VVAMLWRFCTLATAAAWVLMAMLPLAFGSPA